MNVGSADIAAFGFDFPDVGLPTDTDHTTQSLRAARTQGDGDFMSTIAARR